MNDLQYIDGVKIGVLTGSLLSTIFGYLILLISAKR
jgi:NhaA family Na+:H+ antiporter